MWFMGQMAIASESASVIAWFDKLSLLPQAIVLLIIIAPLAWFTKDDRFRPIYQSWVIATLFALPAFAFRFISNAQLIALTQIVSGLIACVIVFIIRRTSISFNFRLSAYALFIAPILIAPFIVYGAPGSLTDVFLNVIAGLVFGLLAALLIANTTENFLLNSLGVGALLAFLGSGYGNNGSQLLLITAIPSLSFVVAALTPSLAAAAIVIGVAASAALVYFDPVELTIMLGGQDIAKWATQSSWMVIVMAWVFGILLWASRKIVQQINFRVPLAIPLAAAVIVWGAALGLQARVGKPGFYGDRIFVIMKSQADVSSANKIADRNERLTFVYKTLVDHANTTQSDLRKTFDSMGAKYTPYYLVNAMEVDDSPPVRLYLATRADVDRVIPSPRLRPLPEPASVEKGSQDSIVEVPGWNIKMIGADKVWSEFKVDGKGIVIGQSDSGVDGDHVALRESYRGRGGNNDYNWFDPWDHTSSPNDEGGHGTHTLGTILGKGGIGVAPGAQWIGCVNLNRNLGNPALYLDCMQFHLAPFPQNGNPLKDGDPTRAAHVLNNSWGCPTIEGCDPNALLPAVIALRHAGIFVVVSTGNDGPNCSTVGQPLSLYADVFSVGAVNSKGNIAEFSSRGPVTSDKSNRVKPDISAPGVDVFSSMPKNTYAENSGTSMAGPHLVGVVALMWSAQPKLIGDIDRTTQILIQTAKPYKGVVSNCGDPKNTAGYGIVDVYSAVKMALGK
jgi:subtilisin family serine protease